MSAKPTVKFIVEAPEYLKLMHGKEGREPKLLGELLSDKRMVPVWARLGRQIKTNYEWMKLWLAIREAISCARLTSKLKPVKDEVDDIRSIAAQSADLAAVIKIAGRHEKGYKRFFDVECHHFFPDEDMQINGILDWSSLKWQDRYEPASKVMKSWPTMSELLEGLAAHAREEANAVGKKRVVLKDKGCLSENAFARKLHKHLAQYTWEPRDYLFATIATIANSAS